MLRLYCSECDRDTEHMTVVEAARAAGVTRATIYNWLHRSLVHFLLRPSGRKLICGASLTRSPRLEVDAVEEEPVRRAC